MILIRITAYLARFDENLVREEAHGDVVWHLDGHRVALAVLLRQNEIRTVEALDAFNHGNEPIGGVKTGASAADFQFDPILLATVEGAVFRISSKGPCQS